MQTNKILLGIIFGMFLISFTSAWSSNEFNNSLSTENITFTGNENFTRWLEVPENTYVTNAFLNLSGYERIYYLTEQGDPFTTSSLSSGRPTSEFIAQNITTINGTIDKVAFSVSCSGTCSGSLLYELTDDNFNVLGTCDSGSVSGGNHWQSCDFSPNVVIEDFTYIRARRNDTSTGIVYINSESVSDLPGNAFKNYSNNIFVYSYDYQINVTFNPKLFPQNISLYLNETQIWDHTGEFNSTFSPNKTSNLASYINTFISGATAVGGYFYVPFIFHSDTAGILEYLLTGGDLGFDNLGFLENSQTYNSSTYETASENFKINISYDTNEYQSVSAKLYYNGTSYTGSTSDTGNTREYSKTIQIPLTATQTNYTFYWTVTLFNGTASESYNSTFYNQTVDPIYLTECNATYPVQALNFTAYDEGDLSRLANFSFDGTFNYWLGDGTVYKNYSISNSSTDELTLCIQPNRTFYIDAIIDYDSDVDAYTERSYLFDDYSISNSSQDIDLLLLKSADSTSFIQEVLENQIPVDDAYIYTYKYYPGTDEWKIVQITKTGEDGKTVGFYETENVDYKHTIIVDGVTEYEETEGRVIIPEDTPYTITFNLGTPVETPYLDYDEELDLSKSLSYDEDTYIVTYTYEDNDDNAEGGRLLVYEEKYATDDVLICNTTSVLSSATLTCNVSAYSGNFIATAFITRNGEESLVDQIRFSKDTGKDVFGGTGVLAGWFLILVAGMAFLFSAVVGIIAVLLATIFVNLIGLVHFGGTFLFGIIAVGIILIWLLKD